MPCSGLYHFVLYTHDDAHAVCLSDLGGSFYSRHDQHILPPMETEANTAQRALLIFWRRYLVTRLNIVEAPALVCRHCSVITPFYHNICISVHLLSSNSI
jgi:hypothetical protein